MRASFGKTLGLLGLLAFGTLVISAYTLLQVTLLFMGNDLLMKGLSFLLLAGISLVLSLILFTFIHAFGHTFVAGKYNLDFSSSFDLQKSQETIYEYDSLSAGQQVELVSAGIIADLSAALVISFVLLALEVSSLYNPVLFGFLPVFFAVVLGINAQALEQFFINIIPLKEYKNDGYRLTKASVSIISGDTVPGRDGGQGLAQQEVAQKGRIRAGPRKVLAISIMVLANVLGIVAIVKASLASALFQAYVLPAVVLALVLISLWKSGDRIDALKAGLSAKFLPIAQTINSISFFQWLGNSIKPLKISRGKASLINRLSRIGSMLALLGFVIGCPGFYKQLLSFTTSFFPSYILPLFFGVISLVLVIILHAALQGEADAASQKSLRIWRDLFVFMAWLFLATAGWPFIFKYVSVLQQSANTQLIGILLEKAVTYSMAIMNIGLLTYLLADLRGGGWKTLNIKRMGKSELEEKILAMIKEDEEQAGTLASMRNLLRAMDAKMLRFVYLELLKHTNISLNQPNEKIPGLLKPLTESKVELTQEMGWALYESINFFNWVIGGKKSFLKYPAVLLALFLSPLFLLADVLVMFFTRQAITNVERLRRIENKTLKVENAPLQI
ncbi:MAG: hypothetical protein NTY47_07360, partial [Candidatus Omnitrophica bacterium]|nr:hypothetical protein [Candidatus Omnitrophota bacterium]